MAAYGSRESSGLGERGAPGGHILFVALTVALCSLSCTGPLPVTVHLPDGTGTSNVTFYVECDRLADVASIRNSAGQFPFVGYDFSAPVSRFATDTLGGQSSGKTIFTGYVGIECEGESGNSYSIGDDRWINRSDPQRWQIIMSNLVSGQEPLVGLLIATYDQQDSYSNNYSFPMSSEAFDNPVAGEEHVEYAAGDDLNCPATSTGVRPMIIVFVGTCLKFGQDTFSYIEDQKAASIAELKQLDLSVNHVVAHELAHVFGISDLYDSAHKGNTVWCVMNTLPSDSAFMDRVSSISPGNAQTIENFRVWVTQGVYAMTLGDLHVRGCTYEQIVSFYESVH